MAKSKEETTDHDILDEVKNIERAVRARALTKMLASLKDKAREVLELKEYTNAILAELGVEDADAKRLIDWVNSLESVKLNENDKKRIKEEAQDDVSGERKAAEKKITESPDFERLMGMKIVQKYPANNYVTTMANNANWVSTGSGGINAVHMPITAGLVSTTVKSFSLSDGGSTTLVKFK